MHRKYALPVMLLSGLLISAPAVIARANDEGAPGMEQKDHHWDPAKLQKDLGLSSDQVAKLKAQHETQEAAMKPLIDKQHELMEKLEGQVKNKASDSDLTDTMTQLHANRKAMADQMEQFHATKQTILTPTQEAKMMIRMHHGMEHHKHMGGKMMMKKDAGSPS